MYFVRTIAIEFSTTKFFCVCQPRFPSVFPGKMFCRRKYFWLFTTWLKYSNSRCLMINITSHSLFSFSAIVLFLTLAVQRIRKTLLSFKRLYSSGHRFGWYSCLCTIEQYWKDVIPKQSATQQDTDYDVLKFLGYSQMCYGPVLCLL